MQRTINHLIQLQDLYIARAQKEASMPGAQLTQLNDSIRTMMDELPVDIRNHFVRLQKKGHLAMVPVAHGVCSGCGINLPVSLVQAVRMAERLQPCPNCARILYYQNSLPRNTSVRARKPVKMGVERFSSPELMIPRLASNDRDDVISELTHLLETKGFVDDGGLLMEEALKREAIVSTAVGKGLAFPHVRGVEGGGLTLALGVSKKGIKFGGPSRTLTRIVFFMVIPTAASAFYLKLLSGLTETFREEEMRSRLLEAETPEKLWSVLIKATKSAI